MKCPYKDMFGKELYSGCIVESKHFTPPFVLTGIVVNDAKHGWVIYSLDRPGAFDKLAPFCNEIKIKESNEAGL